MKMHINGSSSRKEIYMLSAFVLFALELMLINGCISKELKEKDYILTSTNSTIVIGDKVVSISVWEEHTALQITVYPYINESDWKKRREIFRTLPYTHARIYINETRVVDGIKITVKEVETTPEYAILSIVPLSE